MKLFFLISSFLIGFGTLSAQDNWRKTAKSAEDLYEQGRYADAAELFMKAYKLKDRYDFLYQAGESYYRHRDYRKAARAFRKVQQKDDFPFASLLLGRCLKQDEQYASAEKAFIRFLSDYKGKDKRKLKAIVETEIEGCAMGLKELDNQDQSVKIEMLSESINTIASEFAPVAFTDDVLYFSSTIKSDKACIYRSQRKAGNWSEAITPKFPSMPAGHFCNGSFSPDTRRFYFTICNENRSWGGPYSDCDIYVTYREGSKWSAPEKLRDYIKMDGTTATHPFVAHRNGKEVLYYATNRKGGQGGLDIWYTTRSLDSDEMDFSLPQNAGNEVNTPGDEVTPFYDADEGVLYFSSNGHLNIGGYDIYRSKGSEEQWASPQRLSGIANSSSDDYYYVPPNDKHSGYLVSNRLFGLEKISTTQDDIFTFYTPQQNLAIGGKVFNKTTNNLMLDAEVALYEVQDGQSKRLLHTTFTKDGNYSFNLIPQKKYVIEASKTGYSTVIYEFDTYSNEELAYNDFYLSQQDSPVVAYVESPNPQFINPSPSKQAVSPPPTPIASSTPAVIEAKGKERTSTKPQSTTTDVAPLRWSYTPKHSGVYYKVQCKAVVMFDPNEPQLKRVAQLGRLDTEYMIGKGLTRVLLAEFFSLNDAMNAVNKVRNMGFPDAFLVKYRDGNRITP